MQIDLDISDLKRHRAEVRRAFRALPRRMLKIGKFAADYERNSHEYQNRTGRLEASTQAALHESSDSPILVLMMTMPYASHVNRLGYSNIDEAAELCEQQLSAGFAAMAKGLES